ncbi:MAG TPA: ABC transporter substrate-binding protein [Actinomycetota bacterium]
MKEERLTISRRRFLQAAGAGAGAAAMGPVLLADRAFASTSLSLRVGVMAPSGGEYTSAGANLLEGIRLRLAQVHKQVGSSVTAVEVPLGFGGADGAAEQLLSGGVDVVIAGITAPVAGQVASTFEQQRVPLIVANLGAHAVRQSARSPYVLHHGLHYWQSSFSFGSWAASHLGSRAFVAAPLADTGYDTVYAFRRGLESAGGQVVGTFVTETSDDDSTLRSLFAAASAASPDFVYALFSGSRAARFVRGYASSALGGRVPLTGGGLMVDDYLLSQIGSAAFGVRNALPWVRTASDAAAVAFRKAFRRRAGREPDAFALIGYEAAMLAVTGAQAARQQGKPSKELISALAGADVAAPRGTLTVDGGSNTVRSGVQIRTVRSVNGSLANVSLERVAALAAFPGELSSLDTAMSSGYLNEYLHAQ